MGEWSEQYLICRDLQDTCKDYRDNTPDNKDYWQEEHEE